MKRSKSVEIFLQKADDDLLTAQRSLRGKEKIAWIACFHAQQSAEKQLKAYLLHNKIVPRRTHDLLELFQQCVSADVEFELLVSYGRLLNPFSVQVRYSDELMINLTDAKNAIQAAKKIREFVLNKI